jgi:tetratricopeptide (TPR) repeat protein
MRAKADEIARNLRKLALFLEEAPGFRLGLATYDVPETRETSLKALADAVADRPIHLTRLDLSRSSDEDLLLQRLQDHLHANPAPEGRHSAVMITGLESAIDFHQVPVLESFRGGPLLRNANVQRDAYSRLCPIPIVIWLNPWGYRAFAQTAPDLWHWRSGTFAFTGPPEPPARDEQISIPLNKQDRLPRGAKSERIGMLQDLIRELVDARDRETRGNKARRARLLLEVGKVLDRSSAFQEAIPYYEEALNVFRTIADQPGEGNALAGLADTYETMGQLKRAISYFEPALVIARQIGDRRSEAAVLSNLGNVNRQLGQAEQSKSLHMQALAIGREIGDRRGECVNLLGLGNAHALLGQVEKAISDYEKALEIAREIGDRRSEAAVLGNLGNGYRRLGQLPQAVTCFEQNIAIAREFGDRVLEAVALSNLGTVLSRLGSIDQAIQSFEASLGIAEGIREQRLIEFASSRLAELRGVPIASGSPTTEAESSPSVPHS